MRNILVFAMLLSGGFLLAQDNSASSSQPAPKGQITVRGCVSRSSGDYILMKQDPAVTYELQATGKTKLRQYLGQRVEVTGTQAPSLSTSSDSMARMGSASPVTITIDSIKTISKDCRATDVSQ